MIQAPSNATASSGTAKASSLKGLPGGRWAHSLQSQWWKPRATLLCRLLQPLSWLYQLLFAAHRVWVQVSTRAPKESSANLETTKPQNFIGSRHIPTLVVGNWVVGGAGKTPTCRALIEWLRDQGYTPGLISRGYGRQNAASAAPQEVSPASRAIDVGDEPLLLARLTGVPTWVCRDRAAARRALLQAHPEVDIVVSDDGLQHHALSRDLNIIVFDERGVGNGLCLPAGPLRQRLPLTPPPSSIVLFNASSPTVAWPGHLAHRRLAGLQSLASWAAGEPLPQDGNWKLLQGLKPVAAAGIAVPQRFFDALQQQGIACTELPLPDHHEFSSLPWPPDTADVIVTEKDAIKLQAIEGLERLATRMWVARLDFDCEPGFWRELQSHLAAYRPT